MAVAQSARLLVLASWWAVGAADGTEQHEVPTSLRGFEERHDRRLLTVFTASNYCGMAGNYGAIVVFDSEMSYTLEEHMAPGILLCSPRAPHLRPHCRRLLQIWPGRVACAWLCEEEV